MSWPSVRDVFQPGPATAGASQSELARVQSHTHAAAALSGSCSGFVQVPQPHDQIDENLSSPATCRAARACHFTVSSQACVGFRCARPISALPVWNPSITPSRDGGIPIARKRPTAVRSDWRIVRLASTGPCA